MHRCICVCKPVSLLLQSGIHSKRRRVFLHKNHRSSGYKMFCFSQLNSTYTRTNTTHLHRPRRLTAEVDWTTLWIFSRSWVNTLANMWFINMPGATPSSVRQRLISYSNTEWRFPEFQPRASGNQPGVGEKISCAAKTTYLLYYPSVLESMIITWVSAPDLIVCTCLLLSLCDSFIIWPGWCSSTHLLRSEPPWPSPVFLLKSRFCV